MASPSDGLEWFRWTPDRCAASVTLRTSVARFEAAPTAAGKEAQSWLRNDALDDWPALVPWLAVRSEQVVGFFALAASSVELSTSDRGRAGTASRHAMQPAALVAWLAVARDAAGHGLGDVLLRQAYATARRAAEVQGALVLVVDAFDEETERYWREQHGFRSSRSRTPRGRRRLWAPLHPHD